MRSKFADFLLKEGFLNEQQLDEAAATAQRTGKKLEEQLLELHYLDENALHQALSKFYNMPFIDVGTYQIDPELKAKFPERIARQSQAILLKDQGGSYLVGISHPENILIRDEIQRNLNKRVEYALVAEKDVTHIIDLLYRKTKQILEIAENFNAVKFQTSDRTVAVDDTLSNLLNLILEDAVQVHASDIHIEPETNFIRLRFRIYGFLQEHIIHNKAILTGIIQCLKINAHLDISERFLPQEGGFRYQMREKEIDARLSIIPTEHGESAVIRLLDKASGLISLEQLGMDGNLLENFKRLLHRSNGMIWVTGPTGSGKSTTLYAALNKLNDASKKIISIEDPIEYQIPRVVQVQANDNVGLTFSRFITAVLRQDPDIIMVGEVRDQETAEVAVRAALTGHLVLSTLHTYDSISTIHRLMDMGMAEFLLAATVRGILAQRLVRKLCKRCCIDSPATEAELAWLTHFDPAVRKEYATFKTSKGCIYCNNTGYQGRTGVFELLILNEEMAKALNDKDADTFRSLAQQALKGNFLVNDAIKLVKAGITSIDEILRVIGEVQ